MRTFFKMKYLQKKIKRMRKEMNVSQKDFALQFNMCQSTISFCENGNFIKIKEQNLILLHKIAKLEIPKFLNGIDTQEPTQEPKLEVKISKRESTLLEERKKFTKIDPYIDNNGFRLESGKYFRITHIPYEISDIQIEGYIIHQKGCIKTSWNKESLQCNDLYIKNTQYEFTTDDNLKKV